VAIFYSAANFGGVWKFASKLDQTSMWASINDAMQVQQGLPSLSKLIIGVAISVAIAAAPEYLWNER
jgi:hypothetical protein